MSRASAAGDALKKTIGGLEELKPVDLEVRLLDAEAEPQTLTFQSKKGMHIHAKLEYSLGEKGMVPRVIVLNLEGATRHEQVPSPPQSGKQGGDSSRWSCEGRGNSHHRPIALAAPPITILLSGRCGSAGRCLVSG